MVDCPLVRREKAPGNRLRNISQAPSFPPVNAPDGPNLGYGEGWKYLSYTITFALAVALWALGGVWLDRRLGTLPLFTVVGTLAGMATAGYWLMARVKAGRR